MQVRDLSAFLEPKEWAVVLQSPRFRVSLCSETTAAVCDSFWWKEEMVVQASISLEHARHSPPIRSCVTTRRRCRRHRRRW